MTNDEFHEGEIITSLLLIVLFACPCVVLAKPGDLCGEDFFFLFRVRAGQSGSIRDNLGQNGTELGRTGQSPKIISVCWDGSYGIDAKNEGRKSVWPVYRVLPESLSG